MVVYAQVENRDLKHMTKITTVINYMLTRCCCFLPDKHQ